MDMKNVDERSMTIRTRKLGKSGIEVSAIGLGCWAIGGPLWYLRDGERLPLSWGKVDDKESIRTIHRALDLGITLFDTADAYGCGHSERILGQALEGRREDVIIATKFGSIFDETTKTWLGHSHPNGIITQEFLRKACEASLKRLNTDYIDLYQLHWKDYDADLATGLLPVLEDLVSEGKIRYYGWSTPDSKRLQGFVEGSHCTAIQYNYNILERNPNMLALCEKLNQASIARGPFAMGLLTGKYSKESKIAKDDLRHSWWNLQDGRQAKQLEMLEAIREIITYNGRTMVQAALGWLLALSHHVIPIPGFKTMKQVEENIETLQFGPLTKEQMHEIDQILENYSYDLVLPD